MSLSASPKIFQPLPLNSTRSNEKPLFFDPFRSTSKFLGSRFRLPSLSQPNSRSRSSPVVAVSDVVKEKKLKPTSNLVLFRILDCQFLPYIYIYITDLLLGLLMPLKFLGNGVIYYEISLSVFSWNHLAFSLLLLLMFNLFISVSLLLFPFANSHGLRLSF